MATFTPLESAEVFKNGQLAGATMRGRGHQAKPLGIVTDKTCRVYISNIPLERIERDAANALRAEFEAYGPVESYNLFIDKTGRFVGNGICTYRNPADAAMAMTGMNGQLIDGTPLSVTQAKQHGVVLLRQDAASQKQGFLNRRVRDGGEDDSGSWRHDKYELLAQGKEMEDVLGIHRRGGRGGRGGGGRGGGGRWNPHDERVNMAFEKYLSDRDQVLHPDADFDKYIAERDALRHGEEEQANKPEGEAQDAAENQPGQPNEPPHNADTAPKTAEEETN